MAISLGKNDYWQGYRYNTADKPSAEGNTGSSQTRSYTPFSQTFNHQYIDAHGTKEALADQRDKPAATPTATIEPALSATLAQSLVAAPITNTVATTLLPPNAASFASAAPIGTTPLREDLGQLNLPKSLPKKRQRR